MRSYAGSDEVRRVLDSVVDQGRAALWWRAAESAADAHDWEAAVSRFLHVANVLPDVTKASRPAWRLLAVAVLDCAVRSAEPKLVTQAARATVGSAWRREDDPDELLAVFRTARQLKQFDEGRALAEEVAMRFPSSGWGAYALGDFAESKARSEAKLPQARVADAFRDAAKRFDEREMPDEARHARFRAAVVEIERQPAAAGCHQALREAAAEVDERELGWLAFGRVHAPFWLDRVRAADWALDRLEESPDDPLAQTVAALFCGSSWSSAQPVEQERAASVMVALPAELASAFGQHQRATASIAEHLESDVESTELTIDSTELSGVAAVSAAWRGQDPSAEPNNPVARAVAAVLRDLQQEGESELATQFHDLTDALTTATAAELRLGILPLLRACEREDATIGGPLTQLAFVVAATAAAPSFGFAAVADALFRAGHDAAACAFTRRAYDENEAGKVLAECTARAVRWAAQNGSDAQLLNWLEIR